MKIPIKDGKKEKKITEEGLDVRKDDNKNENSNEQLLVRHTRSGDICLPRVIFNARTSQSKLHRFSRWQPIPY